MIVYGLEPGLLSGAPPIGCGAQERLWSEAPQCRHLSSRIRRCLAHGPELAEIGESSRALDLAAHSRIGYPHLSPSYSQ
jgi:hypothetical protein